MQFLGDLRQATSLWSSKLFQFKTANPCSVTEGLEESLSIFLASPCCILKGCCKVFLEHCLG